MCYSTLSYLYLSLWTLHLTSEQILMTLMVWPVSTNLLSKTINWKMLRCFVLQFFFEHFLWTWTWKVNKMHKNLIHALTRHLSGKCFTKELTYAQCISVTLRWTSSASAFFWPPHNYTLYKQEVVRLAVAWPLASCALLLSCFICLAGRGARASSGATQDRR